MQQAERYRACATSSMSYFPSDGIERAVMLVFGGEKHQDTIALALAAADKTGARAVLFVASDDDAAATAARENVPYIQPDCDGRVDAPNMSRRRLFSVSGLMSFSLAAASSSAVQTR